MKSFDELYSVVKDMPIIDWHNHLDMKMLAEDKPLGSLYEAWVKADPYKHRAMRICGESERLITGDATESEKWEAWTRTLPKLVGNPLFTWAKMEMEFLGIDGKENISLSDWTPSKMLQKFKVETICPCVGTSDPFPKMPSCVVSSLRMNAGDKIDIENLKRFNDAGCRVVDISVDDAQELRSYYHALSEVAAFASSHNWTMLLHLGALRSTSERLRDVAGPAGGFAGMRKPVDPALDSMSGKNPS